jgi:hypothetical protein
MGVRQTELHKSPRHLPNAQLSVFPNSGHGAIFEYHEEFLAQPLPLRLTVTFGRQEVIACRCWRGPNDFVVPIQHRWFSL